MNDVRYTLYTERIQNMLIRPEILQLMKDGKMAGGDDRESALERAKRARGSLKGTRTLAPHQMATLEQEALGKGSKKASKKKQEPLTPEQIEEQRKRQQEYQKRQ